MNTIKYLIRNKHSILCSAWKHIFGFFLSCHLDISLSHCIRSFRVRIAPFLHNTRPKQTNLNDNGQWTWRSMTNLYIFLNKITCSPLKMRITKNARRTKDAFFVFHFYQINNLLFIRIIKMIHTQKWCRRTNRVRRIKIHSRIYWPKTNKGSHEKHKIKRHQRTTSMATQRRQRTCVDDKTKDNHVRTHIWISCAIYRKMLR